MADRGTSPQPSGLLTFIRQQLERCPSCGVRRYRHGWNGRQSLPFGPGYFHGPYPPFKGMEDV